MSRRLIPTTSPLYIVMLGLLSALPPFGTDAGLPGIPSLEADLRVSTAVATQTMTFFLGGFSLGPVLFGPLSDVYGRKPLLLLGAALFALGALGCAQAGSISVLLVLRVLQGLGAGAAAALPPAIVRDVFHGEQGLSRQSYVALVNAVAPLVAPLLGAAALNFGSWRVIYLALAAGGVFLFLLCAFGYAETAPRTRQGPILHTALRAYAHVLGDRHYLLSTGVLATCFGSMFAYITGSASVFMDLFGESGTVYALLFALTAAGTIAGAFSNSRLVPRWGATAVLTGATVAAVLVTLSLLILAWLGVRSAALTAGCVMLSNFCAGIIMPNATHRALAGLGHVAGSAAALQRALQVATGVAGGALLALIPGDRLVAMAAVMTGFAVVAVGLLWTAQRAPRTAASLQLTDPHAP